MVVNRGCITAHKGPKIVCLYFEIKSLLTNKKSGLYTHMFPLNED